MGVAQHTSGTNVSMFMWYKSYLASATFVPWVPAGAQVRFVSLTWPIDRSRCSLDGFLPEFFVPTRGVVLRWLSQGDAPLWMIEGDNQMPGGRNVRSMEFVTAINMIKGFSKVYVYISNLLGTLYKPVLQLIIKWKKMTTSSKRTPADVGKYRGLLIIFG